MTAAAVNVPSATQTAELTPGRPMPLGGVHSASTARKEPRSGSPSPMRAPHGRAGEHQKPVEALSGTGRRPGAENAPEAASCLPAAPSCSGVPAPAADTVLESAPRPELIDREHREVLLEIARGRTARQVAARHGWSIDQAEAACSRLHDALRVRSNTAAVAMAHQRGLLPTDPYPPRELPTAQARLLEMLAAGSTTVRIAARTAYSASTVRRQIAALYEALGALNRPNAVHIGYCTGLLGAQAPAAAAEAESR